MDVDETGLVEGNDYRYRLRPVFSDGSLSTTSDPVTFTGDESEAILPISAEQVALAWSSRGSANYSVKRNGEVVFETAIGERLFIDDVSAEEGSSLMTYQICWELNGQIGSGCANQQFIETPPARVKNGVVGLLQAGVNALRWESVARESDNVLQSVRYRISFRADSWNSFLPLTTIDGTNYVHHFTPGTNYHYRVAAEGRLTDQTVVSGSFLTSISNAIKFSVARMKEVGLPGAFWPGWSKGRLRPLRQLIPSPRGGFLSLGA